MKCAGKTRKKGSGLPNQRVMICEGQPEAGGKPAAGEYYKWLFIVECGRPLRGLAFLADWPLTRPNFLDLRDKISGSRPGSRSKKISRDPEIHLRLTPDYSVLA